MDAINVKNLLRVRRRRRSAFVRRKLKMLLKEYKKQQVKIATKIGIVYEKNNKEIVVLPYFDSAKKYQIWGVCVDDDCRTIMVNKEDFGQNLPDYHKTVNDNRFYVLMLYACIKGATLPDVKDIELILKHKKEINDVMDLFIKHGIKANKLNGSYVIYNEKTSYDQNPENKMIVFNFDNENNNPFSEVSCFEHCLTRLIKR